MTRTKRALIQIGRRGRLIVVTLALSTSWVASVAAQPKPAEPAPAEPAPAEPAPAEPAPAEPAPAEPAPAEPAPAEPAPAEPAPQKPAHDAPPSTWTPPTEPPVEPASKPPSAKETPARDPNATVYELDARVDVPLFLIPGLISVGWVLADTPARCAPLCDPSTVNAFDRPAAGNFDQIWRLGSDITLFGALGGAIAVTLGDGWIVGGLQDFVVVAQSIIWANGLGVIANLSARRPRPLLFSEEAPLETRENPAAALSFVSGHSALVAAATTSVFSTTYRRNPDRPLPWIVLGVGTATTVLVGIGRVMAGRHFPSDVLIGTGLGASTGFLLPAIHDAPVQVTPVASQTEGRVVASGTW